MSMADDIIEETGEYVGDRDLAIYGAPSPGFPVSYHRTECKTEKCPYCGKEIAIGGPPMRQNAKATNSRTISTTVTSAFDRTRSHPKEECTMNNTVTLPVDQLVEIIRSSVATTLCTTTNMTYKSCSFEIGQKYFIRTVTMAHTGRVVSITESDIELADAAWIADTGRFADALRTGDFDEIEPFPNTAYVSRASIVDFCVWEHDLPRKQK